LFQDTLGSVIMATNAAGQLTEKYRYTAYGLTQSVGANTAAFRYTGRRYDAETGLYHYRARAYSPTLGRFLQTDPAGTAGGINLYAYVGNNPLNATDPTGLWSPGAHDAILQFSFGNRLSAGDIAVLQQSSRAFDSANQGFGAADAPLHSMRALGQTPAEAIVARDQFIDRTIAQAQQLNQAGDRTGALQVLGQALHPIMDASSPEHTTPDGQPRLWAPWSFPGHSPADCPLVCGSERVQDLTPAILNQQNTALNNAYDKVFNNPAAPDNSNPMPTNPPQNNNNGLDGGQGPTFNNPGNAPTSGK
jgi:RHS repeat-associated protein